MCLRCRRPLLAAARAVTEVHSARIDALEQEGRRLRAELSRWTTAALAETKKHAEFVREHVTFRRAVRDEPPAGVPSRPEPVAPRAADGPRVPGSLRPDDRVDDEDDLVLYVGRQVGRAWRLEVICLDCDRKVQAALKRAITAAVAARRRASRACASCIAPSEARTASTSSRNGGQLRRDPLRRLRSSQAISTASAR
jgi:hypothetical protein